MPTDQAKRSSIEQVETRLGSQTIEAHDNLVVGDRVRHSGHQWPAALRYGTGTVETLYRRPDGHVEVQVATGGQTGVEVWDADKTRKINRTV